MSNSIVHDGSPPPSFWVVISENPPKYWIYTYEGHALNRVLKERKNQREARIVTYSQNTVQS